MATDIFALSVLQLLVIVTIPSISLSLSPDGLSLLALKSAVDQSSSDSDISVFSDWNENDTDPCRWTGIVCMNVSKFSDPRVVGIAVADRNLRAYIPSELGSLVYLRRLNLHGNRFYGSIPDQLFNASSLHSIFLYSNNLSGPLPPSLCHLPRLQNLDLSQTSLSGPLPSDLGNCHQLQLFFFPNSSPQVYSTKKSQIPLQILCIGLIYGQLNHKGQKNAQVS